MTARAFLLKLQPNQDVTIALEEAAVAVGLRRALIVAAVGSIAGAVIETRDGQVHVDEAGLEVAALSGVIDADGESRLHGHFCRQDATVAAGSLVRGRNVVAVTVEAVIEELVA